eukprot:g8526.t1
MVRHSLPEVAELGANPRVVVVEASLVVAEEPEANPRVTAKAAGAGGGAAAAGGVESPKGGTGGEAGRGVNRNG